MMGERGRNGKEKKSKKRVLLCLLMEQGEDEIMLLSLCPLS